MRMRVRLISRVLLMMIVALSPGSGADTDARADETVTLLLFEEQETGTGLYPVRMLVNDRYLRIDEGEYEGDFLLYNRATRKISSVSHEEQSILIIEGTEAKVGRPDFSIEVEVNDSGDIPAIAGIAPSRLTISVDGDNCFYAVVAPGLMEGAVKALIEYQMVLSQRQQAALNTMPTDRVTPCFLTRYVYGLALHLKAGFPLREWDDAGYLRVLMNFEEKYPAPEGIFSLPVGYSELQL